MYKRIVFLIALITVSFSLHAEIVSKETVHSRWRTSFELMPIDFGEDMGLLGLHYDIFPFRECKGCYLGIGGYSGASGEEGGFFTAGLTGGLHRKLTSDFYYDIGLHIGGGGGSDATYPGGGMILRSHAGIHYKRNIGFSFGVANMTFPNSTKNDKSDTHLYAGISLPDSIWIDSLQLGSSPFAGKTVGFRVSPAFLFYKPVQKPITKAGTYTAGNANDDIPLMGIQLAWQSDRLFFPLELYGAAGGGVDGYASLFGGVGYQYKISNGFMSIETKALFGVGGDGRIDTGGGALFQPMIGFRMGLFPQISIAASIGKTIGLDGQFEASSAELSLSWSADKPKSPAGNTALFDDSLFEISEWHGSLSNKTYLPAADIRQTDMEKFDSKLHLFGVELEKPLNKYLSVIGNTYWAHTGNIGSYAEGGLGVKLGIDLVKNIDGYIQGDVLVAGGGDVEVDSGFLLSSRVGVSLEVYDAVFVDFDYGYTRSSRNSFKADTAVIKLRWLTDSIFKSE